MACTCLSESLNTAKVFSPNLYGVTSNGTTFVAVGATGTISTVLSSQIGTSGNTSDYTWNTFTESDFSVKSQVYSPSDQTFIVPSDLTSSDLVAQGTAFSHNVSSNGIYDVVVTAEGGDDTVFFDLVINNDRTETVTINSPGTEAEYYFPDIALSSGDQIRIFSWSSTAGTDSGVFSKFRVYRENDQNIEVLNGYHPIGEDLNEITYDTNTSRYISVGADGLTMVSSDLSVWFLHRAGSEPIRDVAVSSNFYLACGDNNTLYRSPDGVYWDDVSIETSDSANLYGIEILNNYAYAVGENGAFLYSTDSGLNWIEGAKLPNNSTYKDIDYIPDMGSFFLTGSGGKILYSSDQNIYSSDYSWNSIKHLSSVSVTSMAFGNRGIAVTGNRGLVFVDATDLVVEKGFYSTHKPINRVVGLILIDTGYSIPQMNDTYYASGKFVSVGNKGVVKVLPDSAIALTSTDGWYQYVGAEITGTVISDFLDKAADFVDDVKEQVELQTSDLAFRLKEANDFLGKADCLGFFEGNATYDAIAATAEDLQGVIGAALDLRTDALSKFDDLSGLLKGGIGISLPNLRNSMSGLFGVIDGVQGYLDGALTAIEMTKDAITEVKDSLTCFGAAEDSLAIQKLSEAEDLVENAENDVTAISDKVQAVEDLLSGESCIDITC